MNAPDGQFDFDFCSGIYGYQTVSMTVYADEIRKEFQNRGCRFNEIGMRLWAQPDRGRKSTLGLILGTLCRYLIYPLKVKLLRKTDIVFIADSSDAGIFNFLSKRVKTVIYLHSLAYHEDEQVLGVESDLKDRLIRIASRIYKRPGLFNCDLIFTNSHSAKIDFQRFAGNHLKQEVVAAPYGLDTAFARKDSSLLRRELGIAQNTSVILSVAAPEIRKNINIVAQALERLDSRLNNWLWIHIGGLHPWVQGQISEKVRENSLMLDYVDFTKMPEYYSMASVFVLPTKYDPFGWPPHEAAACGCPVVVSDIAPLNEHLHDVAILVDPNSVEQVEEAIYRVLTEPELASELSAKGQMVRERFRWPKHGQVVLEAIQKLRDKQVT
jgi:glycosyltransferase involved in cell wall biosynthesis